MQPKPRDRKASRNSWVDIYNENTILHKHKRLLGQEVETDDGLEWRVKWGQRGAGLSCLLALICYVAGQNTATAVFVAIGLIFLVHCITKTSRSLLRNDCCERPNVVMILVFGLCIWSIDIARPLTTHQFLDSYLSACSNLLLYFWTP